MPKSFLVKKVLWNKKKYYQGPDEGTDADVERQLKQDPREGKFPPLKDSSDNEDVKKDPKRRVSSSSDTCGSISSASSRIGNGGNGVFSGSEFSYSRGFPDTHGLHTLAELCVRRSDIKSESTTEFGKEIDSFKYSDGILTDPQRKRTDKRFKTCKTTIGMKDNVPLDEDKTFIQAEKSEANQNLLQEKLTTNGVGSRLHKLDEELEKMLQGREDIIGREMKEFMENNTLLINDITLDTGLSTTEVSKFLTEGLHLKEEKRRKLFTWYLEKKLSCPVKPEDESFTCYKCGKIFAYENYLARHVKYVCPDKTGRTWKCSFCNKAFQYPCYLRRHMRSHTGESPYKCTQCSRAFVRSTDLQRHLRNHTGEKPYKCQECSRAFARSTDLKRHFRTHTGEKPYKCWQCSKAFSQSGSLQTHLNTHYKESLQVKGVISSRIKHNTVKTVEII